MRVCNLGSGSKGNCTFVELGGHKFLIDCGLTLSDTTTRLALCHSSPAEIEAILISHEHIDHIRSAEVFARNYNTKIYVHNLGKSALMSRCKKLCQEDVVVFFDAPFNLFGGYITPIALSHDASHCSGFKVKEKEKSFAIITDMGKSTKVIESEISECSLLFVEANHNQRMLLANAKYPPILKRRILSDRGHLSNEDCAKLVKNVFMAGNLRQVVLSHLSEENNSPKLAYDEVVATLALSKVVEGQNIKICVANQHAPTPIFKLL